MKTTEIKRYEIDGKTGSFLNYEVREIMQEAWERGNKIYAYEVKLNGVRLTDNDIKNL